MNAIRTGNLLARQWRDYPSTHRARTNLLIHIVAVPVFLAANVGFVVALAHGQWAGALVALLIAGGSLFAQGRGHAREPMPPEAFTGPRNAIARILAEQWLTFPRFVITGGWARAFIDAV